MGKLGGNRNYGYGKQLAWAGKNAIADLCGQGHYSTQVTHEDRWKQFAQFLKEQGINDARKITIDALERYGQSLRIQVEAKTMKVAYAQNLLSTVNVVLQAMCKDTVLTIKPSQMVGKRSNVRIKIPATIKREVLAKPIDKLHEKGNDRTLLVAQLTRELELRFKEASLLNAKQALVEASRYGKVNITLGTKGGRGKEVNRWVHITDGALGVLKSAASLQGKEANLISYIQWRNNAYNQWRSVTKNTEINGFHDMRAAYACEQYYKITGFPTPVITNGRTASKELDTKARVILSKVLGHDRAEILVSYIGSSK